MRTQVGGLIINIGSILGRVTFPFFGAMSALTPVRAFYDAVASGDVTRILKHPPSEPCLDQSRGFSLLQRHLASSAGGGRELLIPLGRDWEGFAATPQEFLVDGDRVVAFGVYSGTAMRAPFTHRWQIHDGFLHDLQERMRAFELALHPAKTRLIRFGRHAAKQREKLGEGKPETFDFLGFQHFCTRSRKWGSFVIGRRTIKKTMLRQLQAVKMELRKRMHDPIAKTGAWLTQMLQGHLNYYAVSGNGPSLWWYFNEVRWRWIKSLKRRSQRAFMSWEKFTSITNRVFPSIRILHPLPCHRFDARTRGKRSYAGAAGVPYRC